MSIVVLGLAGCATYAPLPLPDDADLARQISPAPSEDGYDIDAIATLAVLHNPDLATARAKAGIAKAQAFAAHLLPDPQFNASFDHPTGSGSGLVDAYVVGLGVDAQALLTHGERSAAARAAYDQAKLDLLWQEWQTVAQARTLYVGSTFDGEKQRFLADLVATYAARAERSQQALRTGDLSIDQHASDLALLADAQRQLGNAERATSTAELGLRALLGLAADANLPLRPLDAPTVPTRDDVAAALARLTRSRPDLRALQAGYDSQEHALHAAVLAQFPNIAIGFNSARDTSNVNTLGAGVTLGLPIFDGGRGEIATQRATREQLRVAYQARLDEAVSDAWQLWDDIQSLSRDVAQAEAMLPANRAALERARAAYQARDLSATAYAALQASYATDRTALIDLRASLWNDAIALATLLGTQVQPTTADAAR
jgi:outer membrane protein TolC